MKRKMEEIEVYPNEEGEIILKQPCFGTDDQVIVLNPDQVEIVCKWITDLKKELESEIENN